MEPHETARPSVTGYLIVLVGVAGWVVGCFLPIYRIPQLGEGFSTLYRQISFGSTVNKVGGVLYLFGAISAIGVFSILGGLRIRRWTGAVLTGAVIAWFFVSTGVLISVASSITSFNSGATLGVGYWCCWASVIVVVAGTVVVLVAASRHDVKTDVAPPVVGS